MSCPGPPPIRATAKGNIFTEQQEMDLGDAIAQRQEFDFHIVQDEHLNSYLNGIAQRLLKQMPPTQMKFHIVLVDLPTVNAFTMPGGRIYVTRKLVAFVKTEDELASVLGHELGHALTHQPAAEISNLFREVLGVTQVGDRADVFAKYNGLIENMARKRPHFNFREDREGQLVADSYGLYAMTRAGYSPQVMASLWDRRVHTEGKTGNWFTDLFGTTTPSEQRLRQMRKYSPTMPASCIAPHAQNAAAFRAWQESVIAYSNAPLPGMQSLPGLLWKRQLEPPLESEITNLKFSPDGKYLLAQDDFNVYVLTDNPLMPLFRIPVDDVEPASFTPDSRSVLIWTRALHIEKWSIASQQRTDVHEVATAEPCVQSDISPDGSITACVQVEQGKLSFDLSLLDTATGAPIVARRNFYKLTITDAFQFLLSARLQFQSGFFHMNFSPDEKYFAISNSHVALAWDLRTHAPVKLAPVVKDMMSGGFAFDGSERIVGINASNPRKSGSAQFPSGPAGMQIAFYRQTFAAPAHGDGVLVRPAGDNAVALVDLKTGKAPVSSKISALDVYDNVYARPQPDGSIAIFDLATRRQIVSTHLPGHWIGPPQAAVVSPDLKWFAASGRTRGAMWNLATGERVFHVRGFDGCGFSSQDNLYADFPAYLKEKRAIGLLNPITRQAQADAKIEDDATAAQLGSYVLYIRGEKRKWNGPVDLEVHDVVSGAVLWTKHFDRGWTWLHVYALPSSDEMVLVLPLNSDEAKEQEGQNAALRTQLKQVSSKDSARLIEVVNAAHGKLRAEFAVDTGNGSFTVRQALPAGKWVVVADDKNRALIYSLDGKLTGRLFGTRPTASSASGLVALESQAGTIAIYDLATLAKSEELAFGMPLSFYQLVDRGSKLFAVTEDQTAYLLSLEPSKSN